LVVIKRRSLIHPKKNNQILMEVIPIVIVIVKTKIKYSQIKIQIKNLKQLLQFKRSPLVMDLISKLQDQFLGK